VPPLKYTRDFLAPIVAASRSYSEVMRRLGLEPTGGNFRAIQARIRNAELDTSHFAYQRGGNPIDDISEARLHELVRESNTVAQVLAKLGLPDEGRPHRTLSARLRALAIDTSHFRGRGWSRGDTKHTNPSVAAGVKRRAFTNDEVFVENSPVYHGRELKWRLLELGWVYRCAWCEISEWRGKPLVLHLDHINGVSNDNRFVNLRFLCPNCHSQTDTYCNKRR
jgi:hypothetical protein